MRVIVHSGLEFCAIQAQPMMTHLRAALSVPNPRYAAAIRMGRRLGSAPERLSSVVEHGNTVRIPRGASSILRDAAHRAGISLEFEDRRVFPAERVECESALLLRNYQSAAVDQLQRHHQGVCVFPCGAGKTYTACGVVERLRTPTLIIVGARDLANQWCEELHRVLSIDAGMVGGGIERPAPVTVAMVQTLARWPDTQLADFLARFGLLTIDEAHHTPANTFARVVDRCPAKYRLALTATPDREDGLGPLLRWYVGPEIARVSHSDLISAGALVIPEIRVLETNFVCQYAGPHDYNAMLEALVRDEARNTMIVNAVSADAQNGHTILVLSNRVEHCASLVVALQARGVSAAALTRATPNKKRRALLQAAREGSVSVLVATSLADEGLDLPRLSRVVLAFPSKARGRTEQRLGRLMRPHAEKRPPTLIDVVDVRVGVLRHQHRQRVATFRAVLGAEHSRGAA